MGQAKRLIETKLLPGGWTDLIRQIALFAGAFMLYDLVRGLVVDGSIYKPFGDAMKIINFERAIHIFVEPSVQAWAMNKHWLMDATDWTYLNGHVFVTLAVLVFIYLRRNDSFYFVRNMFMISMAVALVGYALYPTAPPRLLPEWGFTDTVTTAVGQGQAQTAKLLFNPYAAMPSMHVAFALMLAVPAFKLISIRAVRALWTIYPAFVTFVVVVTANHFWIDGALGALVAAVSAYGAYALGRLRPEAWAWRTERDSGPPGGGLGAEAPA